LLEADKLRASVTAVQAAGQTAQLEQSPLSDKRERPWHVAHVCLVDREDPHSDQLVDWRVWSKATGSCMAVVEQVERAILLMTIQVRTSLGTVQQDKSPSSRHTFHQSRQ
jgi:hypothetical protein